MKVIGLGSFLLSVLTLHASGQSVPSATATKTSKGNPYAAEPAVIERRDTVYRSAGDGTGTMQVTTAVRVQSEAALKELGVVTVSYTANTQHVEFQYVRVRRPDGTVAETPVQDAMEIASPVTQQAPFYSDLKAMQLPVRSLRVGDTLEWQATVVSTKAEAPGEFWGQESFVTMAVVLSQTLELHVPKDSYVNVWSPAKRSVETVTGTEHVFRWETAQLKPTVGPEAEAEKDAKKKRIWTAEQELNAEQGPLPDVAWTSFKSWQAVGEWYRGLEASRVVPDAEVKAKVAALTEGKTSEEAKVRAVYGYVSGQIRYIGVAFGIGRYQPHAASVVLENQYGDCKDKHTLLAAMLTALGLHPDAVLIGSGARFNEAVPSPGSFNHLITRVALEDKEVWLDSTAEVAPYRMLVQPIRGHQALVIPESGQAKVERAPADPPFPVFQAMDAVGTLDKDGTSNSRLTLTLRGDDELVLRAVLRQAGPSHYDEVAQQISQGMGYGGTVSHAEISGLEDTEQPLKVSYDYKREKGGDWPNHRIVPQVPPVLLFRPDPKDAPVQTISLGVRRVETATSAMKLPQGWGAELPEAVHQKSAYATYDETYRFEKGTLYAMRRVEVLKEKVPVAEWKSYSKWADAVDLGNELYVQLTHTGASAAGAAGAGEAAEGPGKRVDASGLMREALTAIRGNNLAVAEPLLEKVKAMNPSEPRLWSAYGYVELRHGETTAAVADFRRELEFYPEEVETYPVLVQTLLMANKHKDAEQELLKWAKADAANPVPGAQLVAQLVADGDAAAALKEGEAEVERLPEDQKKNEPLQLQLGRAQLAAGEKDKGRETLVGLLQRTEDAGLLNDAAYELADAKLELPLAESSTRKALNKMEEESRTWTLDENLQELQRKTQLIAATWDTLGWVLFREGKTEEAESFVRASWQARQSTVVGEHLGEIEQGRGNKDAALTAYELAERTISGYDSTGVRQPPGTEETKLKKLIEALRKEGARSAFPDAPGALEKMRVLPLGGADGFSGTAEYRLLLNGGGIEKAEATTQKDPPGGRARLMKAKLPRLWPQGSEAKLVRTGILNCHSGICELVLEP